MLSVAEAREQILQQARPLPPAAAELGPALLGVVLAEDVVSDLDVPPHDKALMDGFALRSGDVPEGQAVLAVVEEIHAGQVPRKSVGRGQASRIMTGAPVPAGADAVVMVERTRVRDDGRLEVKDRPPRPGQHILPRGREIRAGETVLRAGAVLRPQEVGVLATLGKGRVNVVPVPRVAVLSTGDELVNPDRTPGPGQIRNSNGPMLLAQVRRAGGAPSFLGIARDEPEDLRRLIEDGLRQDVLILSGGVSAGKRDLVPGALQEAGVVPHLHKVAMKPGKPVFFGTLDRGVGGRTLVFGLPGNPVSSFVGFELFVRLALRRLAGAVEEPANVRAVLAEDFAYNTDRPTYHPAWLEAGETGWGVRPVPWFGSSDLRALMRANALLILPAGDHRHRAGQAFAVLPLG
jgi:molybdopterin molybdotransferase